MVLIPFLKFNSNRDVSFSRSVKLSPDAATPKVKGLSSIMPVDMIFFDVANIGNNIVSNKPISNNIISNSIVSNNAVTNGGGCQ